MQLDLIRAGVGGLWPVIQIQPMEPLDLACRAGVLTMFGVSEFKCYVAVDPHHNWAAEKQ